MKVLIVDDQTLIRDGLVTICEHLPDVEAATRVAWEVGGSAHAVDVRDGDAFTAAVRAVADATGRLDVLFNNAGSGDLRPLHTVDDKLWHRLIDVNLTGTFNGMRAAVPLMQETGRGTIDPIDKPTVQRVRCQGRRERYVSGGHRMRSAERGRDPGRDDLGLFARELADLGRAVPAPGGSGVVHRLGGERDAFLLELGARRRDVVDVQGDRV